MTGSHSGVTTDRPARPLVLHVSNALLRPSETFVQRRMSGRRTEPVALTWERLDAGLAMPCPSVCLPLASEVPGEVDWARPFGQLGTRIQRKVDLLRVLRAVRPDVVHAHFGWAGVRVDRECRLLGIPLVVTFYGKDVSADVGLPGVRRAYARMFASARAITAEGPALARRLLGVGAPPSAVKLLPLALPPWALEEPVRQVEGDARTFRLLQVARFVEKKGIDTTLEALAMARREEPEIHLTLVGSGELEGEIRAQIAELGLSDAVDMPGFMPYSDLPKFLARSHALIQPSRTGADGDGEGGAPAALCEAQAQAVPILGTTHDDLPTVVRHGVTGLIAEQGDARGVADNILALARDRELAARLGAQARPFVLRRHDPDRMLRLRERIYLRAIGGAKRRPPARREVALARWFRPSPG